MTRILIVDDHRVIRTSLSLAFQSICSDISVAGVAESGEALFSLLASTEADLVLLDMNLPGMGGAETARRLRRDYPAMKILVMSAENAAEKIKTMIDAGIHGFISKEYGGSEEIAEAIRTVMNGLEYFGSDIASIIFSVYVSKKRTTDVTPEFSQREREVIELCREGLISKEIAARLDISPHTVNTYKERIFRKLGINNVRELLNYTLKNGIIRVGD
jgi:DNA-binding NarL/FixJ family response regulator